MRARYTTGAVAVVGLAVLLAGCGDSGSKTGQTTPSTARAPAAPSRSEVASWPTKWCSVEPGVSVSQLEATMGPPTQDDSQNPTDPSLSWSAYEYQFNAFVGVDGNIRQMDINTIQMTDSEKSALKCDTTRKVS